MHTTTEPNLVPFRLYKRSILSMVRAMNISGIKTICIDAFRHFTYREDPPSRDTWVSYADDVQAGRHFYGDCDDISSTILDLLARNGVPADHLWRGMVRTANATNSSGPDHMVGYVKDDEGQLWVVGDTYRNIPYPISTMEHEQIHNSPCTVILWYNTKLI